MTAHPTEEIMTCCGTTASIDVLMIPLMLRSWLRGVHTCNGCCQGDPGGTAWIAFPDLEEADRFVEAILAGGAGPNTVEGWDWRLRTRIPPSKAQVHLRFPYEQIAQVADWLTDEAVARHAAWTAELYRAAEAAPLEHRPGESAQERIIPGRLWDVDDGARPLTS